MANDAAAAVGAPAAAADNKIPEFPPDMDREAELLEAFAGVPSVTRVVVRPANPGPAAVDGPQDLRVTVFMSQRNLPGNSQRKFAVHASLPADGSRVLTSLPTELPDVLLMAPSPSGSKQVVFKSGNDTTSMAIQIWQSTRLVTELHVPKSLHGALVNDGYFAAGVAWSPDESAVAYTAEAPPSERTPAWCGPESLKDAAGPKSWRGQGTALEDWGELNTGKRSPLVFVLDLKQRQVVKVCGQLPADLSVGQPVWSRDGQGLVVAGWPAVAPNFPDFYRRLGVVYCYNRAASLYHVPVAREGQEGALAAAGTPTRLTKLVGSALSPVFSPDGHSLLFVSHDEAVTSGTHGATAALCKLSWPAALEEAAAGKEPEAQVVVGVVQRPEVADGASGSGKPFPGLYLANLNDEPFVGPHTLLLTSQFYSSTAILAVDLNDPTATPRPITPLDDNERQQHSSYSLAAVAGSRVFAVEVGPSTPPRVVSALLPSDPAELGRAPLAWTPLEGCGVSPSDPASLPPAVSERLSQLRFRVMEVTPTVGDTSLRFDSLVWYPEGATGPLPTVITPHGGPHTAVTTGWYMPYAYLAALGYAVISPNYRGSTGYGQAGVASLPGNIGTNDVQDCMAALQAAVDAGIADPARVAVVGGSHGGFLSGHLIGQFPDAFRTAVMRNPVCNISLMVGLSDIVDWCYVEALGSAEGKACVGPVASPDVLRRLWQVSPVAHVHNVKVPVTVMLGAKDRRVPPPDGQQYVAALRAALARNRPDLCAAAGSSNGRSSAAAAGSSAVRLMVFPEDTHALDRPQTEFEQWLNAVWSLKAHVV